MTGWLTSWTGVPSTDVLRTSTWPSRAAATPAMSGRSSYREFWGPSDSLAGPMTMARVPDDGPPKVRPVGRPEPNPAGWPGAWLIMLTIWSARLRSRWSMLSDRDRSTAR